MILWDEEHITSALQIVLNFHFPSIAQDGLKTNPDRLLEIWPHMVKVVNYWTSLPKSKQLKCNSFKVVKKAVDDLSIPLKFSFFSYYASLFSSSMQYHHI